MIGDEAGFIRTILDAPNDDTVRLVYADWLEENEQPERAQVIRLQLFSGRRPPLRHDKHCRRRGVDSTFLRTYGHHWPLDTTCRKCADEQARRFARDRPDLWRQWFDVPDGVARLVTGGFVEAVVCASSEWLLHSDTIRARHPVMRVELTTEMQAVAQRDGLILSGRLGRGDGFVSRHYDRPGATAEGVLDSLALVWPGVTFELLD